MVRIAPWVMLALCLWLPSPAFAWAPQEAVPRLSDLPPGFEPVEAHGGEYDSYYVTFERPAGDQPGPTRLDGIGNRFPSVRQAANFVNVLREDGYRATSITRIGDETIAFLDVNASSPLRASIAIVTFRIGPTVGSVFVSRRDGTVSIHQAAQVAERVASRMVGLPVPETPIAFGPPIDAPSPAASALGLARQLPKASAGSAGSAPALLLDEPALGSDLLVLRGNNEVWKLEPREGCAWCDAARGTTVGLEFGYVSSVLVGPDGQRTEFWTAYQVP